MTINISTRQAEAIFNTGIVSELLEYNYVSLLTLVMYTIILPRFVTDPCFNSPFIWDAIFRRCKCQRQHLAANVARTFEFHHLQIVDSSQMQVFMGCKLCKCMYLPCLIKSKTLTVYSSPFKRCFRSLAALVVVYVVTMSNAVWSYWLTI